MGVMLLISFPHEALYTSGIEQPLLQQLLRPVGPFHLPVASSCKWKSLGPGLSLLCWLCISLDIGLGFSGQCHKTISLLKSE